MSTVRQKIATHLKTTPDQIQIVANDKMVSYSFVDILLFIMLYKNIHLFHILFLSHSIAYTVYEVRF